MPTQKKTADLPQWAQRPDQRTTGANPTNNDKKGKTRSKRKPKPRKSKSR